MCTYSFHFIFFYYFQNAMCSVIVLLYFTKIAILFSDKADTNRSCHRLVVGSHIGKNCYDSLLTSLIQGYLGYATVCFLWKNLLFFLICFFILNFILDLWMQMTEYVCLDWIYPYITFHQLFSLHYFVILSTCTIIIAHYFLFYTFVKVTIHLVEIP